MTRESRRGLRMTWNDTAGVPHPTVAEVKSAYRGPSPAHPDTGFTSAMLIAQSTGQPPPRASVREVVDGTVGLLSGLPASQRLRAPGPLQALTTEGLVREVVDGTVGLLSGLPASQRLRAPGPLQALTTEGLVGKAAQRRRGRP